MAPSVPNRVLKAFGTILRDRRKTAGQTQAKLSDRTLLSRATISDLEAGRQEPCLGTLLRLGRGLEESAGELLRGTEELLLPLSAKERIARNTEAKIPLGTETCPGCRAEYRLYARRLKQRERGKFKCPHCKMQLASWLGTTELVYEIRHLPKLRQSS